MRVQTFAGLALAVLLSACLPKPDANDQAASRAVFDQAHRGDFRAIESRLQPQLRTAEADAGLRAAAALIPADPPKSIRQVGYNLFESDEGRDVQFTDEYAYPDKTLVVSTSLHRAPGKPLEITGFRITPYSSAQLKAAGFSLVGKTPKQYLFFAATILSPLIILVALIALVRAHGVRLKWLWALVIAFGLGQVSMNWATGEISWMQFGIQLLGAGFFKANAVFAPWVLTVSLPIGAILFLARRLFTKAPAAPSPVEGPSA